MGVQHPKLVNLFLKACFWPLKILFLRTVTPTKRRQGILLPQQWWDGRPIPSPASPRLLLTQTNFWDVPSKKRLWFFFRFRCRNQALVWFDHLSPLQDLFSYSIDTTVGLQKEACKTHTVWLQVEPVAGFWKWKGDAAHARILDLAHLIVLWAGQF